MQVFFFPSVSIQNRNVWKVPRRKTKQNVILLEIRIGWNSEWILILIAGIFQSSGHILSLKKNVLTHRIFTKHNLVVVQDQ